MVCCFQVSQLGLYVLLNFSCVLYALLDLIKLIIFGEDYELCSSSLCTFLHPLDYSFITYLTLVPKANIMRFFTVLSMSTTIIDVNQLDPCHLRKLDWLDKKTKLHNGKIYDLYYKYSIVNLNVTTVLTCARHIIRMGEKVWKEDSWENKESMKAILKWIFRETCINSRNLTGGCGGFRFVVKSYLFRFKATLSTQFNLRCLISKFNHKW